MPIYSHRYGILVLEQIRPIFMCLCQVSALGICDGIELCKGLGARCEIEWCISADALYRHQIAGTTLAVERVAVWSRSVRRCCEA